MPLLVEEVLQPEIGVVHLLARVRSGLLVRARGMIGSSVECLESREERAGTDGDEGGVVVEIGGVDEFAECVELLVGGGRQDGDSIVLCERHGGHVQEG